jgi:heme/copper-type cytochrome/quinol oxidase subunit 2
MKKKLLGFIAFCSLLLASLFSFGQETDKVDMAEAMRNNGKIYVVVAVIAIIFIGLIIFLITIDRKVKKLEKQMDETK